MRQPAPQILVAHSGKQHAYWHACSLQRLGLLAKFVTSGYYKPDRWPDKVAKISARAHAALLRRHQPGLDSDRVIRRWSFELPELRARRRGAPARQVDELVFRRDTEFDRWVARKWAAHAEVYWGFQGSCEQSLAAARSQGRTAIMELATVHAPTAVSILKQEAERHPEWAHTISNYEFPDWYRERLEREPHNADLCIVASDFTRQSLLAAGISDDKIERLPLGADLQRFYWHARSYSEPKFRILFVGGVGQRKGIRYLLEAVKQLNSPSIELVIAGPISGSSKPLEEYAGHYRLLGRLDQSQVVQEMQRSHVLVLPSVLEGFGLVIPEAMATGLPVISSTHSAAPEIIREGLDGYVLAPDDVDGLATRLEQLHRDRGLCREMSHRAAERAREFTWDAHRERLAELIQRRLPQLKISRDDHDDLLAVVSESLSPVTTAK